LSTLRPAAVVTNVEGTTTPLSFVRGVLFPYARAHMAEFVGRPDAEVRAALAETVRAVPGQPPLTTLLHWMDQDAKVAPLKTLQGLIWREGFTDGTLTGVLYPDVAPGLRRWLQRGLRLYAYSYGSAEAQRLLFQHASEGDLSGLFSTYFDTRIGSKRDPDSFIRLAIGINVPTMEVLFLSHAEVELDAAAVAGMRTCQLLRRDAGGTASEHHPVAADFDEVARVMELPHSG
jgi:enolase-phosphatase E1